MAHHTFRARAAASRSVLSWLVAACSAAVVALLGMAVFAAPASAAPRPDMPQGASITLDQTTVAPGGSLAFTGTGWTSEADGKGAVIGGIKLDDVDQLNTEPVTASPDGTVQGRVSLPSTVSTGEHWLRFLSGSDQQGDQVRSLHVMFTVKALETGTPSATATDNTTATDSAASTSTTADAGSDTDPGSSEGAAAAGPGDTATGDLAALPKTGTDTRGWIWAAAGLAGAAVLLAVAARLRTARRNAGHG